MRTLTFSIAFLCTATFIAAQTFELDSIQHLSTSNNFVQKPVWSPHGNKILLTGEGNNGLYLLNMQDQALQELNTEAGMGREALWINNSTVQIRKKGNVRQITPQETKSEFIDTTYVYVDLKERLVYKKLSNGKKIQVTSEKANYYNPILSPKGDTLVVHIGSLIYLMPTDASATKTKLAQGIAHSWSKDGRFVFYFLDETSDGQVIDNSDLYVFDIQTMQKSKLTDTPNVLEMWPAISPDGSKLAFTDGKSGKLYIANLKEVKK